MRNTRPEWSSKRPAWSAGRAVWLLLGASCASWLLPGGQLLAARPDPGAVAAEIDRLVEGCLETSKTELPAGIADETFLRRVYLKLTGTPPSPDELTYFALDPDPGKRPKMIDRLLATPGASGEGELPAEHWTRNWARYWRDAVYSRVQDRRVLAQSSVFEEWLTAGFREDRGWDALAREMVVATGDVSQNGATSLIFAQQADPGNVAAETARLFMGIQIQCAQCHDHPYDDWSREQFHEMAAFFPRVRIERKRDGEKRNSFVVASFDPPANRRPGGAGFLADPKPFFDRFDANRDGKLASAEVPRRVRPQLMRFLKIADKDKDRALTLREIAEAPVRGRRPRGEHFMPDLENPEAARTYMRPKFFISGAGPGDRVSDLERRRALAGYITGGDNPWFSKAFVNRVWSELIGTPFVSPVDDLGPHRDVAFPEVFELLSSAFEESGYSLRWLLGTIARTRIFGAEIRLAAGDQPSPVACSTTRLRGDQLFDSLVSALGLPAGRGPLWAGTAGKGYRARGGLRALIAGLFGFDPSTPEDEVVGTIPQALFLMNSRLVENAVRARGGTLLARLVDSGGTDDSIVGELYLTVLSRRPTPRETAICLQHLEDAEDRRDAFEDIYWSLLNSTEFLYHR